MRELFNPEERESRLNFTMFFTEYFIIRKNHVRYFKQPLTIDKIYGAYKLVYPDSVLSLADLEALFAMLGFDMSEGIFVDFRATAEIDVPTNLLKYFMPYLTSAALLQIRNSPTLLTLLLPAEKEAYSFIRLFVKPGKHLRVAANDIFDLYLDYCDATKKAPISRQALYNILRKTMPAMKKGYVNGVSGVFYTCAEIPSEEMRITSLELGLGIFQAYGGFVDNLGKKLEFTKGSPKYKETRIYIQGRIGESYEQRTAPQGIEETEPTQEEVFDGGAIQVTPIRIQGTETGNNQSADNNKPKDFFEAFEETLIPATSDDASSADEYYGNDDDDSGSDSDLDNTIEDSRELEEITTEDIFKALRVVYKLNPVKFTMEEMNSYLYSMEVDYCAEELWDDFMKYMEEHK